MQVSRVCFGNNGNADMIYYLATPYSHHDKAVVEQRVNETMRYAAELLKNGFLVFSPILHCHTLANAHSMPTDAQFWWNYNKAHLEMFKRVIVCEIPGWTASKGVAMEIEWAREHALELLYARFEYMNLVVSEHA